MRPPPLYIRALSSLRLICMCTMTTTASSVASLFFLCLLVLAAKHGASSYESYKLGSKRIFFKAPGNSSSASSQQASTVPPATNCSSMPIGNKLPTVHPKSPCSPLHGLSLTAADVLLRDASRIRRRFSSQSSLVAAPAPSPAAIIISANGSSDLAMLPLGYSVLVSYGTPPQQLPVFLDTSSHGLSLLRCTPCASGSDHCDPAFDMSRSSTFANVLCGSPDCRHYPANCYIGFACVFDEPFSGIKGTFAKDMLTLAPSMAVNEFRFACLDPDQSYDPPGAGTLDLSRDDSSLPSQLSSGKKVPAAAFSYCLPNSPSSQGFLSLGVDATTLKDDNVTVHAPLVSNDGPTPARIYMYFIDLVGMSLGDEDLLMPLWTYGTNLDVGTTFTKLTPVAYMPLRDSFRKQMSQYNRPVQGFDGFDTCFNFTGLNELTIPLVRFKFSNGESLLIDADQQMYYDDPAVAPFTMACLAFSSLESGDLYSNVIGTYTLASTEVVYDVAGGTVGFIPHSC